MDQTSSGASVGSVALRELIEREQPAVTLHGHIHESPIRSGRICCRIGRTWCANPGASLSGLRALWLDLADPDASHRLYANGMT